MSTIRWIALGIVAFLLCACDPPAGEASTAPADVAVAVETPPPVAHPSEDEPDRWVGRWDGPEGTYLSITRQRDRYTLEIADLDGPKTYAALDVGERLEFQRNGMVERIRATDGNKTGMKWLQGKSDCLTIKPGEGFCRD